MHASTGVLFLVIICSMYGDQVRCDDDDGYVTTEEEPDATTFEPPR